MPPGNLQFGSIRHPFRAGWPLAAMLLSGVVALGLASAVTLEAAVVGPLSRHMAIHIFGMNIAAPLAAFLTITICRTANWTGIPLLAAGLAQIVLLWAVHAPKMMVLSAQLPILQVGAMTALFVAAFCFWLAVLAQQGAHRWRALIALLLTGKLFCLLGALLVFAPTPLYPLGMLHGAHGAASLADQQQAGLLMVAICPLTYVAAAVIIAAVWLQELSRPRVRTVEGGAALPAA